jgi:hypothetical protein
MLETLRAYGQERLVEAGEAETLNGRHVIWFRDLAERAARHRTSLRWLCAMDADYDNLRVALGTAVASGDRGTALRLGGALGWYWWMFRHAEGKERLAGVLALAADEPPSLDLARALQAMAMVEALLTPTEATVALARQSVELFERFGDRQGAAVSGPSRPRTSGGGCWSGSGPSTTTGGSPSPSSASARSRGYAATSPGRCAISRAPWRLLAMPGRCGWSARR